jgi:hypothetical protein
MDMDVFFEYLFEKKQDGKDWAIKLGVSVGAAFVSLFAFALLAPIAGVGQFALLVAAAVIYFSYILIRNRNVEYEYIFTNGDLDVDVIRGRKARKRLVSVASKNLQLMARTDDPDYRRSFENQSVLRRVSAVYDPKKGWQYSVLFTDREGKTTVLAFQPPERLLEEMRKYNRLKVH